jgi:hypothetical protein
MTCLVDGAQIHAMRGRYAPRVATRRVAIDLRRIRADQADAGVREPLHLVDIDALRLEHGALRVRTSGAVVTDSAVRADHAVAWNHERDRVPSDGIANSADGQWTPDLGRDPGIGPYLAARDLEHLQKDATFERGELGEVERHFDRSIGAPPHTCRDDTLDQLRGALHAPDRPAESRQELLLELARVVGVGTLDQRDAVAAESNEERRDRTVNHHVRVAKPQLVEHRVAKVRRRRLTKKGKTVRNQSVVRS